MNLKASILITILFVLAFTVFSADIRYGGQYYPGEFLLDGYDFFSEYDLDVDHILFSSGTENNIALISNGIDINVGSDSKTVALFKAMGPQAVIIGVIQRGNRYSTVVKEGSDYQNWEDLKGKKVATRFGSGAEFVLRKFFDSRDDLSWNDYQWINLKTEDMVSTLASGQIEAFTVWAPTGEIAVSQDVGRIIKSYGDVALTPVQIHTTRRFAERNREQIIRFLAAHLKKAQMIKEDPELAARYAAKAAKEKGIDITQEVFQLIFERIDFSLDFDESLKEELRQTAEFLKEQGKIRKVPEFYLDTSYLEAAKELVAEQPGEKD